MGRWPLREPIAKFFADRGTHLAAMIAYFALVSFFPLTFLALALLGLAGRQSESSFLVTELKHAFPDSSIASLLAVVHTVQDNAAALGITGAVMLGWSSMSLFSALESAFNIVYGLPNRPFLRGKGLALLITAGLLVALFLSLLAGSIGFDLLKRFAPGFVANGVVAYAVSVLASTIGIFGFLVAAYALLTNTRVRVREALPGAILATVALEATFQVLPVYLRLSKHVPALQAFGGPVILLVWLYVMANVIVFGAEINWWYRRRRRAGAKARAQTL